MVASLRPSGLTSAQARQRLAACGPNLAIKPRRSARILEIAKMLIDPMAIMLAIAGCVYLALGERIEGTVLLGALVPVVAIDVLLEVRSDSALKQLASRFAAKARVIRDAREQEVSADTVVPDDVLIVAEGDIVHADGAVLDASNLATDESLLTGEAEPISKRASLGPQDSAEDSRVFGGSRVVAGHGLVRVTATGGSTRYGAIAQLVKGVVSDRSPLQRKVGAIVRWTAVVAIAMSVGVFAAEVVRGAPPDRAFLYAITLAMAAVGEEFLVVLTLFLSVGAFRLGRIGVLVRRITSVETLGATTVICLDKTGTLTTGAFVLREAIALGKSIGREKLLAAAVLACEPAERDAIEKAIVSHCAQQGVDVAQLRSEWSLVHDYDFDPRGKHMSHVWRSSRGTGAVIVAKGSLEGVLEHCEADAQTREEVASANLSLAGRGLRVLAVAARASDEAGTFTGERAHDERRLTPYGLLGFDDAVRAHVPEAVAECQQAGIKLKLISGDHPLTVHAVANATGMIHRDDRIMTGAELDRLGAGHLREIVNDYCIFARTRPEQKYAIVDALVRSGEIVAMTGDGVNDAPALRRANIGISMGQRATEVARAAADMVLLNDDFASLVATIREGRRLFGNIEQAFRYLIGFKAMVIAMAVAVPVLGLPILLTPLNLVWLELIVHPVSAFAFEGRDPGRDVMRDSPRDPRRPILGTAAAIQAATSGLLLALGAVAIYLFFSARGEASARATAMIAAIAGSLLLILVELAGNRAWWRLRMPKDVRLWTICAAVAATPVLFTNVNLLARPLRLAPVPWNGWLIALGVAMLAVAWRVPGVPAARSAP